MRNPLPVAKPFIGREEEAAVAAVLRSRWLTQGKRVAEFEERFGAWVGARHAVAVSSGTTALHLALVALGIGPGDEVICPSLSFIATANAIRHAGAEPVFVDIDARTYNIDPARIEKAVTRRTRAIMPVHQIGLAADLDPIVAIARRRRLKVVEDAACSAGAQYRGAMIGRPHGDVACFSFHPRKVLTTAEGGLITTADAKLAGRLRRLRQHAMSASDTARHSAKTVVFETFDEVGYNYRMSDVHAAIGLVQLGRMPAMLKRRRALAARYTAGLAGSKVVPPHEPPECVHTYQSYAVRVPRAKRDGLMRKLLAQGIATRRVQCIHREKPYRSKVRLPETESAADSLMVLPLFHEMTERDVDRVVRAAISH